MSRDQNISPPAPAPELPPYLRLLPQCRAVLCVEHQNCYGRRGLDHHLRRHHGQYRQRRRDLLALIDSPGQVALADQDIVVPADGGAPISGLLILEGFVCEKGLAGCRYRSTNLKNTQRHCLLQHGHHVRPGEATGFQRARLQTLWTNHRAARYFVICPAITAPISPSTTLSRSGPLPSGAPQDLLDRFRSAQEDFHERYNTVQGSSHVSETSNWLRATGYGDHLEELTCEDIPRAYALPKVETEETLHRLCQSLDRVLRQAYKSLPGGSGPRRVNRLSGRILNSERADQINPKPLDRHQNEATGVQYRATWQGLLCYVHRVTESRYLDRDLFHLTREQVEAWDAAWTCAKGYEDGPAMDEQVQDRATLRLCMTFIRHPLIEDPFRSALVSYAAVLAWDGGRGTWRVIGNYTSSLSQLLYGCRLLVLAHVLDEADNEEEDKEELDLSRRLKKICKRWMVNDTNGPVAELLGNRLLGFALAKNTVAPATCYWYEDEETVVFQDLTLSMAQLRELVAKQLEWATVLLERDLLLGLEDAPRYNLAQLRDNWDEVRPGRGLVEDARNQDHLEDGIHWLLHAVVRRPELRDQFLHQDGAEPARFRSDSVQQYEGSVRRFLEHLLILVHVGSGMPGRSPEILGLRYRNSLEKRNLILHDGRLVFVMPYHKTQTRTGASRHPCRFLPDPVAQLLVRYLVMVQPFRLMLKVEVGVPEDVTEFLWSQGQRIWSGERMSRVLAEQSRLSVGVRLTMASWRQIAKGIVLKKFPGMKADFDLAAEMEGSEDMEDGGSGSLPAAWHFQASHTPHAGNQTYGGTVNFRHGLTDAALQSYLHVSRIWHHFLFPSARAGEKRGHRPTASTELGPSLKRRLELRQSVGRPRRRWTLEQAQMALRQLYGPEATYRSDAQREALQAILVGTMQLVVVQGTGTGKTVLYVLPTLLPGATTTVVILPLVALIQDQVRRCEEMGVPHAVWTGHEEEPTSPLLFVGAEHAVTPAFLAHLFRLDAANRLDRVVLDECHLVLTAASYRPRLGMLKTLREVRCPFVYLTATLPPGLERDFCDQMFLHQPHVIRGPAMRDGVSIFHWAMSGPDLASAVADDLRRRVLRHGAPDERFIVYVSTRSLAREMADHLACETFFSDSGSKEEKAAVAGRWREGTHCVIVATSAFGLGIDYPHVRGVFHVGAPHNAIDYIQEIGRAGRDGELSLAGIYLPAVPEPLESLEQHRTLRQTHPARAEQVMQEVLRSRQCRRGILTHFFDGVTRLCESQASACQCCRAWIAQGGTLPQSLNGNEWGGGPPPRAEEDLGMAGRQALADEARRAEMGLARYLARLEALQGQCILCRYETRLSSHSLARCPHGAHKQAFFSSKKRAQMEGAQRYGSRQDSDRRTGWLTRYAACFGCGNPQAICDRQGRGGCRYADLVLPSCWVAFQDRHWRASYLARLHPTGPWGEGEGAELEYMLWLGEERLVHGVQASRAMEVADVVLAGLLGDAASL